jgi:hypothetical protein
MFKEQYKALNIKSDFMFTQLLLCNCQKIDILIDIKLLIMTLSSNKTAKEKQKNASNISYESLPKLDWKTRLFYSFGHIYNDLCASVWYDLSFKDFSNFIILYYLGFLILSFTSN